MYVANNTDQVSFIFFRFIFGGTELYQKALQSAEKNFWVGCKKYEQAPSQAFLAPGF